MHDGIRLADVGQELVAEALALAGALYKARNVHEFHDGRNGPLGLVHVRQNLQTGVRHGHDADVGVDRAERIVCGLCARLGQRIEKGALPDVGKAHDTEFHVVILL